jgi:hypothetical protein
VIQNEKKKTFHTTHGQPIKLYFATFKLNNHMLTNGLYLLLSLALGLGLGWMKKNGNECVRSSRMPNLIINVGRYPPTHPYWNLALD